MLPITTRQFTRAVHAAANMAEIKKRVTPHTSRHYAESRIMPNIESFAAEGRCFWATALAR
jgi:hypothetical protein